MNSSILSVKDIEKCPGFGFFPSEECLINIFLAGKNSGQAKESWPILEIDLCAYEPNDLIGLPTAGCDNYKYYFHRRQYSNEKEKSYKRRTKTGYWKSSGNPRKIKGGSTKRSLVFYKKETIRGSKAVRAGWTIQEYDNGGEYVIAKLQIKNDKTKKRKLRRRQNVSMDEFTEDNPIVYRNSEVQNVSTDDAIEDNQIDSHNSEDLRGFEDQNQKETMVTTDHNKGETTCLMAPVYNKNSFSTESGCEYQSPAISSDLEYYNLDKMTANYSACQDTAVVPSHFVDQNGNDMNTTMLTYNEGTTIWQEGFNYEAENQFSTTTNESPDEWSLITAPTCDSFLNEASFNGEGKIFSPYWVDWSLQNDLASTMMLLQGEHRTPRI